MKAATTHVFLLKQACMSIRVFLCLAGFANSFNDVATTWVTDCALLIIHVGGQASESDQV